MLRLNLCVCKTPALLALASCLTLLPLTGCTSTAPDTRAADAKTLRDLDTQWSKAVETRDLNASLAVYADDAVVMPGDGPTVETKQGIHDLLVLMMDPAISISWKTNQVEVARSGDLGYVRSSYLQITKDPTGKATTERGKILEIWKRQADGKWKCAIDNFSADAPPVAPVSENK